MVESSSSSYRGDVVRELELEDPPSPSSQFEFGRARQAPTSAVLAQVDPLGRHTEAATGCILGDTERRGTAVHGQSGRGRRGWRLLRRCRSEREKCAHVTVLLSPPYARLRASSVVAPTPSLHVSSTRPRYISLASFLAPLCLT